MKVFLINLDQRPDRHAFVKNQLDKLCIDFERVSATDGRTLNNKDKQFVNEENFFLNCKKNVVVGEIGCAISHRAIWQKIVEQEIPHALILEDDITISPLVKDFLCKEKHYDRFDFLNISSNVPYNIDLEVMNSLRERGITERPSIWTPRPEWKSIEWRHAWRIFHMFFHEDKFIACECDPAPALGSGYIVSSHGAQNLLSSSDELIIPIDLTWRISGGKLRQGFLATPLINQTLNDSNITGREQLVKMTLWQKIKRRFIKVKRWRRRIDVLTMYGWKKL